MNRVILSSNSLKPLYIVKTIYIARSNIQRANDGRSPERPTKITIEYQIAK